MLPHKIMQEHAERIHPRIEDKKAVHKHPDIQMAT
jgi:hypothetical protein